MIGSQRGSKRIWSAIAGMTAQAVLLAGCSGGGGTEPESSPSAQAASDDRTQSDQETSEGTEAPPHWSYDAPHGAAMWASMAPEFALCDEGTAQSPIALENLEQVELPDPVFEYLDVADAEVVDTGHTMQVNVPAGSSVTIEGTTYDLKQLHFHAPSEHIFTGTSYPVGFHFVHTDADGTVLVVAVPAEVGKAINEAWKPILNALPRGVHAEAGNGQEEEAMGAKEQGERHDEQEEEAAGGTQEAMGHEDGDQDRKAKGTIGAVSLSALLPADTGTIRYEGSFTTPPCSEGVLWVLFNHPIQLSQSQIDHLRGHYNNNNRPLQPPNDRNVVADSQD